MARKKESELVQALKATEIPVHIPCEYPSEKPCDVSAMCRVPVAGGWRKLCLTHYDQHFRDLANAAHAARMSGA